MAASGRMVRRLPVINGYVKVPGAEVQFPTTLTPAEVISLIPGSQLIKVGQHKNDTEFVELPEFDFAAGEDYYAILRAAAG